MTVLVDDLVTYPNKPHRYARWCHMASDVQGQAGRDELHALAEKIGMQRSWFQNHSVFPHYDLVPSKRAEALRHGAVAVDYRTFVKRVRPDLFAARTQP